MKKIKCTNNYPCHIYFQNLGNKNTIVIDFNIKSYQIFNSGSGAGWEEHKFPENVIIQDKLYLDEKLKNQIVDVLETFIKDGDLQSIITNQTNRGFNIKHLKDMLGNLISIQESSSASEAKIWFGIDTNNKAFIKEDNIPYQYPDGNVLLNDRLHLNIKKAQQIVEAIKETWVASMMSSLDDAIPKNRIDNIPFKSKL